MKSINDYTEELNKRIEQKTEARAKKRVKIIAACVSLALIAGVAAAVLPMLNTRPEPLTPNVRGNTDLKVDKSDKFILNNAEYGYDNSENGKPQEDRDLYRGLKTFTGKDELYFSLYEDGPIYCFDGDAVSHIPGRFENGVWFGADMYDGYVYMPATSEIICGAVRTNGICRYNVKTQKTESVISGEGATSGIAISGYNMFYASHKNGTVTIKMCDLSKGVIYEIARIGSQAYTAEIGFCDIGLAVMCGKDVFSVTLGGEVKKIAEDADGMAADGDVIYVCRGVDRKYESGGVGYTRYTAQSVEIYSGSGEKVGEFNADGYQMLFPLTYGSEFTVYEKKLAAIKDKSLYLIDPISGETKKVLSGDLDAAYAARVGDRLLVVNETGYENRSHLGDVYLISGEEVVFKGELPDSIFGYENAVVRYDSIDEAADELLYERIDFPVDPEKLDVGKIYGYASVYSDVYGEHREINMGVIYVEAQYDEKRVDIQISQDERVSGAGFAEKLGYGDYIERSLFTAESLPLKDDMPDGVLWQDLITKDGEPFGIMAWFESENGETVDCEIRLLCETENYTSVVTVEAYGIDIETVRSFVNQP